MHKPQGERALGWGGCCGCILLLEGPQGTGDGWGSGSGPSSVSAACDSETHSCELVCLFPSRPQLGVTWPHMWVTEGPRSPSGVRVARSQGLKSAGTLVAPVSQYIFNREMKAWFTEPGQRELCESISKSAEPWIAPKDLC